MSIDRYTDALLMIGSSEPSFTYLIDSFLQSRIATEHESNQEYYDEDVNVYLSLLLNSVVSDRFHRAAARYVAGYESDLPEILDRADTDYTKYRIYRANADFLLLQTGLFTIPGAPDIVDRGLLESVERGKTYYRFACSFSDRIPERYRALSGVLAKLSYGFEVYREILSYMRGEFLNLVESLSERELKEIRSEMDEVGRVEALREARDTMLDAYLDFRKEPDEQRRIAFEKTLEAVRKLDPGMGDETEIM